MSETTDLLTELAAARSALVTTVQGLTDEQAAATPTASKLCLAGIVKHVASTEASWLRFILDGPTAMSFDLPEGVTWGDIMAGTAREYPQWMIDHQNEFRLLPGETLAGVLAHYEEVATESDKIVADLADLDKTYSLPPAPWNKEGATRSVRQVLIHVIAETTQHAGHADIIRESIDGQTSTR
ncbi:DinB family protein [Kutzneria buriramensis]|uniref:Uncharacterized protein DUF664 n=1 Tax=Kutzneria buriramensis TaxID=1045776 RepID=A0A3E0H4J4_9PSEU|nr:DinB family protein [Kutzneria buriramensis]REH38147.1 uncharacterized protein DUF664 [Kutzneria buriramensis]